jgi:tRNA(Ile)-lysidine synthase
VDALHPRLIPQPGDPRPVLVGFSGGLDSSVLLQLLATTPGLHAGLRAIHVDHGLHAQSAHWAAHCAATCAALGIPFQVATVQVVARGDGLEAAARAARHAAFAAALGDGEVLALAHHADDQAETFLLRAMRASGPDGLAAMRAWRDCDRGWLWRPLLDLPRAALLEHARASGLAWIEDPGNADLRFDRNFLRQRLLPVLRERWPHAATSLARSALLCGEAAALLDAGDADALAGVRSDDPAVLDVPALRRLPRERRARVLRLWIAGLGLPPLPASGIARLEGDLLQEAPAGDATFAWSGARLRRWRQWLHGGPALAPLPPGWRCEWDGSAPLPLPGGGTLRLHGGDGFDAPVHAHARLGGERIRLPGRGHTHALKHVLQDLGVPPWLRERLPLLSAADGTVLAAGDRVLAASFATWLQARGARIGWDPGWRSG